LFGPPSADLSLRREAAIGKLQSANADWNKVFPDHAMMIAAIDRLGIRTV
jgi:hypothetical protein